MNENQHKAGFNRQIKNSWPSESLQRIDCGYLEISKSAHFFFLRSENYARSFFLALKPASDENVC